MYIPGELENAGTVFLKFMPGERDLGLPSRAVDNKYTRRKEGFNLIQIVLFLIRLLYLSLVAKLGQVQDLAPNTPLKISWLPGIFKCGVYIRRDIRIKSLLNL